MTRPEKHVFVCAQNRPAGHPRGSCAQKGSGDVLQAFFREVQQRNLYDKVSVTFSGCLGPCDGGTNVVVYPEGVLYSKVTISDVATIFDQHLVGDTPVAELMAPGSMW